jgi:methylmalonyl-CoA mutase N-terminal domain/subunit
VPKEFGDLAQSPGVKEQRTASGIPVKPLYTSAALEGLDESRDLAAPGIPPYTRGIHSDMYRGRLWTIRQLAGFGDAAASNERFRLLLAQGATGINCVFDYITNRGYDSDHPLAEGDVGQGGVAVDCLQDMRRLFEGIPLDEVSVSLVLSHPVGAGVILAMYLALAEERGIPWERLRGTLQNDFLMETVVLTAPNILEPSFSMRLSVDVVEFCTEHVPQWNPISFAGYNYREAGANAVQEVALVIAHALAVAEEMEHRDHPVDTFAPRLSSFFTSDSDLFEEVAKYRAARRIYHRMFTERFAPQDPRSARLRFHVQTSGSALTAQQPLNNIVRASYHALAAVLGGAQSLHVSAYDEALCLPSEAAALTALRTQQVLVHETGVTRTPDPLAGSYYLESLTNEMEARILAYLGEIEEMGGLVRAVETGWVHRELLGTSYDRELAVTSGEQKVVGVNCFTDEVPVKVDRFTFPDALEGQKETLRRLRAERDQPQVSAALLELEAAARGTENTLPALIRAVKAGASVGECCDVFRRLHGGWHQPLL